MLLLFVSLFTLYYSFMQFSRCSNTVIYKYFFVIAENGNLYIVMDYCEGGNTTKKCTVKLELVHRKIILKSNLYGEPVLMHGTNISLHHIVLTKINVKKRRT